MGNGSLCTRSGFGSRSTAPIWFLGTADQPTFCDLKQIELACVVTYIAKCTPPTMGIHYKNELYIS